VSGIMQSTCCRTPRFPSKIWELIYWSRVPWENLRRW
jgi:hypothetical protein